MPIYLIEEELKDGRLIALNTKENFPLMEDVFLIRRNDRPRGPIAEEMWDILKQF